jgi:hypothetical protein
MNRITIERQAESIERWKADNGVTGRDYVPVNTGARRTLSKRELLSVMEEAAAKERTRPRFVAKY